MSKVKTRIRTYIDWEGDYTAVAEVKLNIFSPWKVIDRYWARHSTEDGAIDKCKDAIDKFLRVKTAPIIIYPENQ